MFAWSRHSALEALAARVAALKDEIAALQPSAPRRRHGWERLAAQAHDWVADQAEVLPRLARAGIGPRARHGSTLAVLAAALAVGAGVGCVLYAVTSGSRSRPASRSAQGPDRPSSEGVA